MREVEHIAVVYDSYGQCVFVAKTKVFGKEQLNKLINEQNKWFLNQETEKREIKHSISELKKQNVLLKRVILHLLGNIELSEEELERILEVTQNEEE